MHVVGGEQAAVCDDHLAHQFGRKRKRHLRRSAQFGYEEPERHLLDRRPSLQDSAARGDGTIADRRSTTAGMIAKGPSTKAISNAARISWRSFSSAAPVPTL